MRGQELLVSAGPSSVSAALDLMTELCNLFQLVGAAPRRRALVSGPLRCGLVTPTSGSLCGFIFHPVGLGVVGGARPLPAEVGRGDGPQGRSAPNGPRAPCLLRLGPLNFGDRWVHGPFWKAPAVRR